MMTELKMKQKVHSDIILLYMYYRITDISKCIISDNIVIFIYRKVYSKSEKLVCNNAGCQENVWGALRVTNIYGRYIWNMSTETELPVGSSLTQCYLEQCRSPPIVMVL